MSSVNLREIGRRCGLSHTAVSLALRNHPRVAAATRVRVREMADKMGYHPNALVAALMRHIRSNRRQAPREALAFLTSGDVPDAWRRHRSFIDNYEGARLRAESLGFSLEPLWLGPRGTRAAATAKVLRARGVRGAVLGPFPIPHGPVELDWEHMAAVALGYSFTAAPLHRAAHHHVNGIFALYRELRAVGYRRIGLAVTAQDMLRVQHFWLAGFLAGRAVHGGASLPPFTFEGEPDRDRFRRWLRTRRPDVVISIGWVIHRWIQELGWRIPRDVGFAHLGLDGAAPRIAGIEQRSMEIGAAAVDLVVGQLYRNEYCLPADPKIVLLDGRWMPGRSAPGSVT